MIWPVIQAERSDARTSTISAISAGLPQRCSGQRPTPAGAAPRMRSSVARARARSGSVRTAPGATALTQTPRPAKSAAVAGERHDRTLARRIGGAPLPTGPTVEAVKTGVPRRLTRCGRAARAVSCLCVHRERPVQSASERARMSPSTMIPDWRHAVETAGPVDGPGNHGGDRGLVGDVNSTGPGRVAGFPEGCRHLADRGAVEIGADDRRPFRREPLGDTATDARRSTSDDRGPPGKCALSQLHCGPPHRPSR